MSCSGLLKSDDVKRAGGSLKALVTHKLQCTLCCSVLPHYEYHI